MNQSLKAVTQLVAIVGAIVTVLVWVEGPDSNTAVQVARYVAPLITVAAGLVLLRVMRKKDAFPDILRDRFDRPFERDGLCFIPVGSIRDGVCFIDVYFQNRYTGDCECDIVLEPSFFSDDALSSVGASISCPGAAVGVTRIPYAVPGHLAGEPVTYKVAATTSYPSGRGRLVRFREGLRVGTHDISVATVTTAVGALAAGYISFRTPAKISIVFPGAAEKIPDGLELEQELLFEPSNAGD
jgi:hypothetical protein